MNKLQSSPLKSSCSPLRKSPFPFLLSYILFILSVSLVTLSLSLVLLFFKECYTYPWKTKQFITINCFVMTNYPSVQPLACILLFLRKRPRISENWL